MTKAAASGKPKARERLLQAGAELIADKGFEGASVREICKAAKTSINMVHHYFGDKDGLLAEILAQYDDRVFAIPLRLLETPPKSREDFVTRLEMLFETTLEAYIAQRIIITVAIRQQTVLPALAAFQTRFAGFLDEGKAAGFVRDDIDSALVTGALLDRVLNQVQFAPWIKATTGDDVLADRAYQRRWCQANLDLFLHGFLQS